jgi:uncharacterized beta-barrel protein YwiB (DUF1934 family)
MEKKVLISIVGIQQYTDGNNDKQEFFTLGNLSGREEIFCISYQESEITGMEGVTTTLHVEPERVILNRIGTVEVKQEFQLGILYHSTYITPFGELFLSVLVEEVESNLTVQGGRISLKYDLFVDDIFVSHNSLVITIKEESL